MFFCIYLMKKFVIISSVFILNNGDNMELLNNFDPQKIIKETLKRGGDFAEIFVEDSLTSSISSEERRIDKVLKGRDRGIGIRLIKNFRTFYGYTNDLTEASLLNLASSLSKASGDGKGKDIVLDFTKKQAGLENIPHLPNEQGLNKKIDLVKRGEEFAWAKSDKIIQVKTIYGDALRKTAIINSNGLWVEEEKSSVLFLCHVIAKEGELIQTGYEPVAGIKGMDLFNETTPENIAHKAVERALLMLKARPAPAGTMPVVLASDAGGTMVHEAVGHGLEADLAGEGLSVYQNKIGEKVASELISVIDDGTIDGKRGSSIYDSEGTETQKNVLIENGILKNYMFDMLQSMKQGKSLTGNGRRETYRNKPIPRMTNTIIASGESDPEEIVKSVDKGLYVKKMGGGQVNTVTGDFVFEVTEGYILEKGKLGDPVRGAMLTGNGPKVLNIIDMVGTDLGFGIGTCGKDGQGVPVSDAQPTIRIPEIVVGGHVS